MSNQKTDQAKQIKQALTVAIEKGFVSACSLNSISNKNANSLSPSEVYSMFNLLVKSKARTKLRKLGIEFPTKKTFEDELAIEETNSGWLVSNLTKGTEYLVYEEGFRLICSCDRYDIGYCKHRDAVLNLKKISTVTPEPKKPQIVTQTNVTIPHAQETEPPHVPQVLPKLLPGFTPTRDQWLALEGLKQWWTKGGEAFFRLEGYAGTGKSTIIQAFVQWLSPREPLTRIAFAAPTNKATKIQRQMLARWDLDNIEPKTCAQLFGIKAQIVEGKQIFIPNSDEEPAADQYDLMIIDEISMINEELWGYFLDKSQEFYPRRHRFILMGDPAQLPPVNEGESKSFTHECDNASLTEVKRYQGAIARIAKSLRDNLDAISLPQFETSIDEDGNTGAWTVDSKTWEALAVKAFQSESYAANPSYCRVLAWRNSRIQYLNAKIRSALGRQGEFEVGDRIIAKEPYIVNGFALIGNSGEAEVTQVVSGTIGQWAVWFLTLKIEGQLGEPIIPVLKQCEARTFEQEIKKLSNDKAWGKFWKLKSQFANIDYSYALTVHKSQGSTFTHGFIDMADIARCRTRNISQRTNELVYERNQLAYVAATRFEQRIFILQ